MGYDTAVREQQAAQQKATSGARETARRSYALKTRSWSGTQFVEWNRTPNASRNHADRGGGGGTRTLEPIASRVVAPTGETVARRIRIARSRTFREAGAKESFSIENAIFLKEKGGKPLKPFSLHDE